MPRSGTFCAITRPGRPPAPAARLVEPAHQDISSERHSGGASPPARAESSLRCLSETRSDSRGDAPPAVVPSLKRERRHVLAERDRDAVAGTPRRGSERRGPPDQGGPYAGWEPSVGGEGAGAATARAGERPGACGDRRTATFAGAADRPAEARVRAARRERDGGHGNLPVGGHRKSPLAATGFARG